MQASEETLLMPKPKVSDKVHWTVLDKYSIYWSGVDVPPEMAAAESADSGVDVEGLNPQCEDDEATRAWDRR